MKRDSLPVLDSLDLPSEKLRPGAKIWGVVLAAGTSSRYGDENKLLAPIDGQPIVAHAVETLLASDIDGVTVIIGWEGDRVHDAVQDLEVEVHENPDYNEGQSTSVRRGVRRAADHDADAVLIALGDMPDIDPSSVDLLISTYEYGVADIVAAAADGDRGNPVLFDSGFFERLIAVDGDTGGRSIIAEADDVVAVETGDNGVLYDIDRPWDLENYD